MSEKIYNNQEKDGKKKKDCKKRDNKNRILEKGERQRKDGCYEYRYIDNFGKNRSVYSWRLTKTDKSPIGKESPLSLREMKEKILQDKKDKIDTISSNMTVVELINAFISVKKNVRYGTIHNYHYKKKLLEKLAFGRERICNITTFNAKQFCLQLKEEEGLAFNTVNATKVFLKTVFEMAVEDDFIRKNPFKFRLTDVINKDTKLRTGLTEKERDELLEFIKEKFPTEKFPQYYEGFYIMFHTGIRASELTGLTMRDIDLKKRVIHINHQLLRQDNGKLYIGPPKSESGYRDLPIMPNVYNVIKDAIMNRPTPKIEKMIDGYTNFLFLDIKNDPTHWLHWGRRMRKIMEEYKNTGHKLDIKVTPHICRHTYCSILESKGIRPKTMQYLMGHSDISVTLNTYTHKLDEDIVLELNEKLSI